MRLIVMTPDPFLAKKYPQKMPSTCAKTMSPNLAPGSQQRMQIYMAAYQMLGTFRPRLLSSFTQVIAIASASAFA
jgi:hypothetical protein